MNKISHKKAHRYIQAAADQLLNENNMDALKEHLIECQVCRKYQEDIENLEQATRKTLENRILQKRNTMRSTQPDLLNQQIKRKNWIMNIRKGVVVLLGMLALISITFFVVNFGRKVYPQPAQVIEEAPDDNIIIGADEDVTITFAAAKIFKSRYEVLIEAFEAQNPNIQVQFVSLDDDGQILDHASAASMADVIMISPPDEEDSYYYLDLEPVLATDQNFDEDAFWSNALEGCQVRGRLIGIPLSIQTLLVMYDGAAFDEIGMEHPAPGWNWEDFTAATQALTQRSGGEVTRYGFVDYNHPTSLLAPMIDTVYRQNGNQFDPKKLANSLNWYVSLSENGDIPSTYTTTEAEEVRDYISTGEAAMWVDALSSLEQRRNDLGESIAVAPFPEGIINGNQKSTQAWATCGLVSAGTTHPQEAIIWLQFLSGHEIPGVNPTAIPAKKTTTDESGFWNKLDVNTAITLRYALEHSWYGSASDLPFEQIGQAVIDAKSGTYTLLHALSNVRINPVSTTQVTPQISPVVVVTPKSTQVAQSLSENVKIVKFYPGVTNSPDMEIMNALAQDFMVENPQILIQVDDFMSSGLPYINIELLSENYDCFGGQSGAATYYAPLISSLQPLIDLDSEAQKLLSDLPEQYVTMGRLNGELYALPVADQPTVVFYNKDIFTQQGVPFPPLEWTWDEFWQTATQVSSEDVYGFVPINGREFVNYLVTSAGIELYDLSIEKPVINFLQPEVLNLFSFLSDMNQGGVIPIIDDNIDWSKGNANERYLAVESGKAAMWFDQANKDSLYDSMPGSYNFDVGVAPLPTSEYPLLSSQSGFSFYISKQSKNQEACWEWFKYLSDKPEAFIGIPLRKSVLESQQYEQIVGVSQASVYRTVMEQPRQDIILEYPEWYSSYPIYLWWPQTLTSIFEGVPVKQALTELQGKSEKYLDCVKNNNNYQDEDIWVGCAQQVDPEFELPNIP
jgi:multiple sugar transport system substrate-binding protein